MTSYLGPFLAMMIGELAGFFIIWPLLRPLIVPQAAIPQAHNNPANKITAAHSNAGSPVWSANWVVPVTQVPTGKVNAHQVSAKGIFLRRALNVRKLAKIDQ